MSVPLAWLIAASWKAALVVALLVLVRALLRGWLPAAWRHALWSLVALRLLIPVGPASPFSLFRLLDSGDSGGGRLLPGLGEVAGAAGGAGAAGAAPASATGLGIAEAAALVWGLGLLVLGARAAVAHRRRRAVLAAARRVTDPALLAVSGGSRAAGHVLLPNGLLARLDERELRHVLLHELAHLKRRDSLSLRMTWGGRRVTGRCPFCERRRSARYPR